MTTRKIKYKPFKVKCGCGCLLDRDELVTGRKKEDGTPTQKLKCKEHSHLDKAVVIYRVTTCDSCGNEFQYDKYCGIPPYYCETCKLIERRKKHNLYAEKKRKGLIKPSQERRPYPVMRRNGDPDRWMCIHWDGKCYENAIKYNLQTRPCKDCEEFKAAPQNHDPMFSRYSNQGPVRKRAYSKK